MLTTRAEKDPVRVTTISLSACPTADRNSSISMQFFTEVQGIGTFQNEGLPLIVNAA
jgi:hypothetical protein